ncbi:AMP-binding protein [Paenisporosarcina cavernae]|uniref:AMP-dependent synthetase n=1 Tax=Paenisporosarcina cavernae TaxID=2320858 RepID=A0A385YX79_9BACL|nr:AMP-binding protein [Paenisporosarcina cavernae]AYC30288.1 AMP-dependent synthetase [Paenisporosarcina cavernae]
MNDFQKIEKFGNQIALYAERAYSYVEMIQISDDISREIGARTLVFCLCSNNKESLFGYVGFIRGKVVPLLLDASISFEQLQKLIDLYEPNFIWATKEHQELSAKYKHSFEFENYALYKMPNPIQHNLDDRLALLLTTSGSTGSPKFVRLSYENIFSNAASIAEYLDIGPNDKPITTLPMSYSYGLSIINSHFIKGASIVITDASIISKEFWNLCKEHNVTTFGGVPFSYEILDKLKFQDISLPSLKKLTQAGGKLPPTLFSKFVEICSAKGIEFYTMYGQTEATARMAYLPCDKNRDKAGSIGIAIPGGEFHLEDDAGSKITQPYTTGELIYKGQNVSLGYAESYRDLSKQDENKALLHTGDLAYFDSDGYYFISGRKKRIIKLYGNRVSLDELELFLSEHGYTCICGGKDDHLNIYTLQDDVNQMKKIMKEKLNLKGYKIVKIDTIPRNHFGKILYSELPNWAE